MNATAGYLVFLAIAHLGAFPPAPPTTAAALIPGGGGVLLGSQAGLTIHPWARGDDRRPFPLAISVRTLGTELQHIHDLAFSPDGRTLLVAGGAPGERGTVEVWDWNRAVVTQRISDHADLVYKAVWNGAGTRWVSASWDKTCTVYAFPKNERIHVQTGHSGPALAAAFLEWEGEEAVASAGLDHTIMIWNSQTGKRLRTFSNHVGTVLDLSLAPAPTPGVADRGRLLASVGEDRTLRLWRPDIGRMVRFVKLPAIPRVVSWSEAGDQLFVGCDDGRIRMIDAETLSRIVPQETSSGKPQRCVQLLNRPGHNIPMFVGTENPFRVKID